MIQQDIKVRLSDLPCHLSLLEKTISVLRSHTEVIGITLTGSIAYGMPDQLSDLDLHVIVNNSVIKEFWGKRVEIENEIGESVFRYDLDSISPFSCAVYFKNMIKLHLTLISSSSLSPKYEYKYDILIFSKLKIIDDWHNGSKTTAFAVDKFQLISQDEKFWFWFLQGVEKYNRGELWACYDTLHTLQSIIISGVNITHKEKYQGFRHLNDNWSKRNLELLSGILSVPSRPELFIAFNKLKDWYVNIREDIRRNYSIIWSIPDENIEILSNYTYGLLNSTKD